MDFSELKITTNEAKAYETLLRIGKASAAQISKESEVPYGKIYPVLASLEQKGLIKMVPAKTKIFVPSDPTHLHGIITKRKQGLEELEKKILEMKSIYEQHEKEPVQIIQGRKNFYKIVRELQGAKKERYDIKYGFEPEPESIRDTKMMIKNKVDFKILGRIDEETKNKVSQWKEITPNIKPIKNEGVAMAILDKEIMMITMIKSNTTLLIRDKPTIILLRELFLNYYQNN